MIKIDDEFTMERDSFGWVVLQNIPVTGDNRKNDFSVRKTYHPNIVQCCQSMLDRKCGKAHTLQEVITGIAEFEKACKLAIKDNLLRK